MHKDFRGEAIYTAEVDVHFPMLTVGQTLDFAASARAPRHIPGDVDRKTYSRLLRDVIMVVFGISHTVNTRVGNDFVRGVSGGERKRVSIAEAALGGAPLQCWDNSTRGLDSANAIEFCKTLKMSTELAGSTAVVAIYQAPQTAYDVGFSLQCTNTLLIEIVAVRKSPPSIRRPSNILWTSWRRKRIFRKPGLRVSRGSNCG
jgi:ATP-binding cassette, subfamily G (WHITE), member 2, PDR